MKRRDLSRAARGSLLVVPIAASACDKSEPPASSTPSTEASATGSAPPATTPPTPSEAPITKASFANGVTPEPADTVIITDPAGLVAGMVSVSTPSGTLPAYRAAPPGDEKRPVVLVVQEIFGLHEYIKDVARRLAKLGYVAIAPDLYHRQGDVTKLPSIDAIRGVVSKVPDAQVMADLDACVAWAADNGGDADRVAITGFCWGGRIVWLYAAHQPRLKAGVAWYGRLASDPTELQPRQALDVLPELKAPVLGLYGGQDTGIPLDTVEKARAVFEKNKKPSTIHVYPDAPHAFHSDYRASYRKEPAEDGWKRMQEWFRKHGV